MKNEKLKIRLWHLTWQTPNRILNKSFCSVGNGYIFNKDSRFQKSQNANIFHFSSIFPANFVVIFIFLMFYSIKT
jgi:hypothetical protein